MTVGPVDRAVDRKGKNALSCCQRADFTWGYKYRIPWLISPRFEKRKIYIFQVFFSKSFWV